MKFALAVRRVPIVVPFIKKLLKHATLDRADVQALSRVLNRRLAVKKGQDIIVQGYEYRELNIVESGFAIRYMLLHQGGRQIINTILPGDIVGFPASFFSRSIFSVMAVTKMSLYRISFDTFVDLCKQRPNIAIALIWFAARELSIYAHHIVDAGRRSPLERTAHFLLEMQVSSEILDTLQMMYLKCRSHRRVSVMPSG